MLHIDHIHPVVVHFPIALLITAFLIDIIYIFTKKDTCLPRAGFYLMIAGTITSAIAYTTGCLSSLKMTGENVMEVLDKHEDAGLATLIIMGVACMLRVYLVNKKLKDAKLQRIMLAIYFLGVISVVYTGLLGGHMVYDYMISK